MTSNRLPILAAEIMRAHAEARQAAQMSIDKAMEAGEALIEAKSHLQHGEWLPWLKANCSGISERTIQLYMRLARHKDEVEAKKRNVADLTIRGAVAAITKAKSLILPIVGHVSVGVAETDAGWEEIWIAPDWQHDGYLYVTRVSTPNNTTELTEVVGTRRPVRQDFVEKTIAHLFDGQQVDMDWTDRAFPRWRWNCLLFDEAVEAVETMGPDDIQEITELIHDKPPSKAPLVITYMKCGTETEPSPFADLVFERMEVQL